MSTGDKLLLVALAVVALVAVLASGGGAADATPRDVDRREARP